MEIIFGDAWSDASYLGLLEKVASLLVSVVHQALTGVVVSCSPEALVAYNFLILVGSSSYSSTIPPLRFFTDRYSSV